MVGTKRGPSRSWSALAQVLLGLAQHSGVVLRLRSGQTAQFLLPSRSTLHYPVELARDCLAEMRKRGAP